MEDSKKAAKAFVDKYFPLKPQQQHHPKFSDVLSDLFPIVNLSSILFFFFLFNLPFRDVFGDGFPLVLCSSMICIEQESSPTNKQGYDGQSSSSDARRTASAGRSMFVVIFHLDKL